MRFRTRSFGSVSAASIGILAQTLSNPAGGWYKQLIKDEELRLLKQIAEDKEGILDNAVVYFKILVRKSW